MTPPEKPEWFQLADNDRFIPAKKAKFNFKIVALSIPMLVIGLGVAAAQVGDEAPASAQNVAQGAPVATDTASPVATPTMAAPSVSSISDDREDHDRAGNYEEDEEEEEEED